MTHPPKAVIFDCDGVLVDSEPITNDILHENLAQHGLHIPRDRIEELFVGGTIAGVGDTAREMGAALPDDWVDQIYAAIYARLRAGTPLVAEVLGVLDALDARGIAYAVGSNGSMDKMQITLGQNGLWDRFAGRMFSAHVHAKPKPEPDLYLLAAEQLGVAPADCVVVDDSPSGCIAAQRASIRCFGYAERSDPARLTPHGAIPVASMAELRAKLGV
ncbi:hypothetical protein ACMU_00370 [Actibacterium mucosum KCTC 23349]|uniref:Hydrolase n=1 Tax=Actibacterium mucosum KCTC 23349 TaxID=1454373 RepID=A0A037ZMX0_9RHOB|nr:HAD family phosphatase [Actibacterium mucosum]KAJ56980.1 hypothetical protein ACMU_00370 [Actibacterium mucosum KCTC 23349]